MDADRPPALPDRRLALPMRSQRVVLPGEEVDVAARPTYAMRPDWVCFDPRSWEIRRVYVGAPGAGTDLPLIRNTEPRAWPNPTSPSAWIAPGARIPVSVDLHLVVAYVGPSPGGEVFCGAVLFHPDLGDPYTSRALGSCVQS